MSNPPPATKMLMVRKLVGLTQADFGEKIGVSAAQISSIERGEKRFTKGLMEQVITRFGVRREWIEDGIGEPFSAEKPAPPPLSMTAKGALVAAGLGPFAPTAAAALAMGIATTEILKKIAKAYGAKSVKELATEHFGINQATASGWIKRNKIPEEYLAKAINDKKITLGEIFTNDEYVMIRKIDLMEIFKKMASYKDMQNLKPSDLIDIFNRHLEHYQKPLIQSDVIQDN